MYQVWLRYLSRFLCSAPETKRAGRKDGRTEGRKDGRTEGQTDGRTEGRKDGRTDGRKDGQTAPIPISPFHFVAGDNKAVNYIFTRGVLINPNTEFSLCTSSEYS